jgi:hypothetical protein
MVTVILVTSVTVPVASGAIGLVGRVAAVVVVSGVVVPRFVFFLAAAGAARLVFRQRGH